MGIAYIILAILVLVAVGILLKTGDLAARLNKRLPSQVSFKDNDRQGKYMLAFAFLFIGGTLYMTYRWAHVILPPASSVHGTQYDSLMWVSMGIISVVFLVMMPVLFYFSYKYRGIEGRKAHYYAHNTKLEIIWTTLPAVALAVLISYGLLLWNQIMNPKIDEDTLQIELYARQFDWTARYAGQDNILAEGNVRYVGGANITGMISNSSKKARFAEIESDILGQEAIIANEQNAFRVEKAKENLVSLREQLKTINVIGLTTSPQSMKAGEDDLQVRELHLPVNRQVKLNMRSQDIIHSALLPHFRVQMNCVPGAKTSFTFTPTKTTEQMKEETENPEFEYVLMCNKICGASHYNMQMKVVVHSEEDYAAWEAEQKPLIESLEI